MQNSQWLPDLDFRPQPITETELSTGRYRSISAEGCKVDLQAPYSAGTNLRIALQHRARTYRINRAQNGDGTHRHGVQRRAWPSAVDQIHDSH